MDGRFPERPFPLKGNFGGEEDLSDTISGDIVAPFARSSVASPPRCTSSMEVVEVRRAVRRGGLMGTLAINEFEASLVGSRLVSASLVPLGAFKILEVRGVEVEDEGPPSVRVRGREAEDF